MTDYVEYLKVGSTSCKIKDSEAHDLAISAVQTVKVGETTLTGSNITIPSTDIPSTISENTLLTSKAGKTLWDKIESSGQVYLKGWKCSTGAPTEAPTTLPYTYPNGAYFLVSEVATSGTNYRPKGTQYTGDPTQDREACPTGETPTVGGKYIYAKTGESTGSWEYIPTYLPEIISSIRQGSATGTALPVENGVAIIPIVSDSSAASVNGLLSKSDYTNFKNLQSRLGESGGTPVGAGKVIMTMATAGVVEYRDTVSGNPTDADANKIALGSSVKAVADAKQNKIDGISEGYLVKAKATAGEFEGVQIATSIESSSDKIATSGLLYSGLDGKQDLLPIRRESTEDPFVYVGNYWGSESPYTPIKYNIDVTSATTTDEGKTKVPSSYAVGQGLETIKTTVKASYDASSKTITLFG